LDERSLRLLEFDKVLDWVTSFARSSAGVAKLRAWRPLPDDAERDREHGRLGEALRRVSQPGEWCFTGEGSLAALANPESIDVLDGPALVLVRGWLAAARATREAWAASAVDYPGLGGEYGTLSWPAPLLERLERCLEPDGRVADRASALLARCRREAQAAEHRLQDQLLRWSRAFGENSYVTRAGDRCVVLVPAAGFPRRRGIVHDVSGSGQSLFVEPLEACEGNNHVIELRARAAEEERRILAELAADVRRHSPELAELERRLAHLDTLRARALWARQIDARALPAEPESERLVLRGARHPLLLRALPTEQVVPLDLELGQAGRILLVSGPNMGGKTVLLKTVGLCSTLAASAFPAPVADGSRVPRFTSILVEMGDEQSVEKGLSTFAAHLESMARMADRASPDTLLLCDELGAGTDPEEGAALGRALLEHFARRRAWAVVTTHLGPLKRVAGENPGVANGTLEFDEATLTSRFRFVPGVPGASYALAVAERRGFPAELVRRARELTPESALALERLLHEVERARREAEAAAERARAAEEEARRQEAVLRAERERLAADESGRRKRMAEQGDAVISRARSLLRELQKAAREGERSRERASQLKGEVLAVEGAIAELRPAPPPGDPDLDLAPGVRVRLLDLNIEAEVVDGPDQAGQVTLQRGAWRIQAHRSRLARAAEGGPEAPLPAWQAAGEPEPALEVDLRGLEATDALAALDRALDRAVVSGLRELRVVHGIGRGVLRSAVEGHLKKHPQVGTHRLGGVGEGGRGVTLVELR
jgi:DNA mismatch repair protein MutS2